MKRMIQIITIITYLGLCINLSFAMYDPQTGRFLQRDPLGIDPSGGIQNPFAIQRQYKDSANTYEYVKSNSVMNNDALGLYATPWLPTPPATSKYNDKACCKIKTTHTVGVPIPGGSFPSTVTTCTQVTIDSKGASPGYACRCYYKNQPNVKVYDWHGGECCWCKISLEFIGHTRVRVDCKGDSFIIHVFPDTFGAWDQTTIHVEKPDEDVYDGWYLPLSTSDISCKQAQALKSLDGEPWYFSPIFVPPIPGDGNCAQFAFGLYNQTVNSCP